MLKTICTFLIALMLAPIAVANTLDGYKQIVTESLTRFKETDRDQWSFKVVRVKRSGADSETSEEIYNPGNPTASRWSLLKENKKAPDEKRLVSYQQQMLEKEEKRSADKEEADKEEGTKDHIISMVNFESLKILQEDEQQVVLSFIPVIEGMGDDSSESLVGELVINKDKSFVSQMKINNTAKLSPAFSVSLKKFQIVFKLTKIDEHILPLNIISEVDGKIAFVKSIEEYSSDSYSDYKYLDAQDVSSPEG